MEKILIANRGEIAVRVLKTAKGQGYRTVAVFSEADAEALHVSLADEAVCIGPAPVGESYLSVEKVIDAATRTGADGIHPGYGFLSENADFAKACADAGIMFIGPSAEAIELMGSKRLSKLAMIDAGVPCVPGYSGEDQSLETLPAEADKIGYPLMIKASAGGGGRGMRLVEGADEFAASVETARSEAENAFGSGELILEKAVLEPRHIEVQVFGDSHGNVVHLFERDCSIQRRHQKVVEEAPSPFMTDELRAAMTEAAINAAKACSYVGAGTVEFLVDKDRNFYFLEMNTRLQVEHPVTELVTGQDLVAWQLAVAEGEPLPLRQDEITLNGHAIEVRLYAEDPANGYLPQTGKVQHWSVPDREGVRVDHSVCNGQSVSAHYDPMLAKIMAYGDTRSAALRRLKSALDDTSLMGFAHNRAFLREAISYQAFADGNATTAFLTENQSEKISATPSTVELAKAALILFANGRSDGSGWESAAGFSSQFLFETNEGRKAVSVLRHREQFAVTVGDELLEFSGVNICANTCQIIHKGVLQRFAFAQDGETVFLDGMSGHFVFQNMSHEPALAGDAAADGKVKAPMDGAVVDVKVGVGDSVSKGDTLLVMEAMKMEHALKAGSDGVIESISAANGDQVKSKQVLISIASDTEGE